MKCLQSFLLCAAALLAVNSAAETITICLPKGGVLTPLNVTLSSPAPPSFGKGIIVAGTATADCIVYDAQCTAGPVCAGEGQCDDGVCQCDDGYVTDIDDQGTCE